MALHLTDPRHHVAIRAQDGQQPASHWRKTAASEISTKRTQMRTAKHDLIDDLRRLEAELRAKADDYLRSSKAYTCRSNSDVRAGLVKGAAVMRMDADRIASIIAKHSELQHAPAVAEIPERTQAPHWPLAASPEPSDQDAGHVGLSGVQAGDGYAGD